MLRRHARLNVEDVCKAVKANDADYINSLRMTRDSGALGGILKKAAMVFAGEENIKAINFLFTQVRSDTYLLSKFASGMSNELNEKTIKLLTKLNNLDITTVILEKFDKLTKTQIELSPDYWHCYHKLCYLILDQRNAARHTTHFNLNADQARVFTEKNTHKLTMQSVFFKKTIDLKKAIFRSIFAVATSDKLSAPDREDLLTKVVHKIRP